MKAALLALLAAGILTSGCATTVAVQPDRRLNYTDRAILPGWTDAKDLVAILGDPARKEKKPDGSVDYVYLEPRPGRGQKKPDREIIYTVGRDGTVTSIRSKGLISVMPAAPPAAEKKGGKPAPARAAAPGQKEGGGQEKTLQLKTAPASPNEGGKGPAPGAKPQGATPEK